MKRLWIYLLLAGIITIISYLAYHYYAPPYQIKAYSTINHDDTLRIAYIGDSWAFMHKDHHCKIAKVLEDSIHRPVKVHSYGICGLTSKEIYENLFENSDMKQFMQKRYYKYCFISAGINDTYKKMGISYYQKSMDVIIQFLLTNNIRPIILEIPDYDINKAYERQIISRKLLRQISMFVNNTPRNCKEMFRKALNEMIREKGYTNNISIIRYQTWNSNGVKDLKVLYTSDGMHLNELGYSVLDSVIANEILRINN